ncbi:DUF4062 domain-containing protein [Mesorhizobium sp. M7A.F.Ca.ET.027.03.2.1]|uniref:DUF4062 domain-containing protein n=1 Tax=Mesorhizobium sp. M7A.F.Ca.ET.027.03.2.1 TaxID=2496656 RepID=UPI000FCAA24C|nr:DUF4062 domain-containing protein [Mesorhizobium sp. M7A.F.Ca.ET.027.03.2.1]RVD54093.1 DUF4062 domain-containing protein [Mesorhizobium sp. M7A.F.Ca.ET.027.03.2.1]
MEQKRYQIFLSSTFSDLEIERRKVMQTLLEMDCIPSGMEFFPASDEETFEFIKTVIDVCDYYVLVVAARYGSVAKDGSSYTEKEYDYAIETGKPVLGFVRRDISQVVVGKTDQNSELLAKLEAFRKKVSEGRLVRMWDNADQLAGQVATTLNTAIKRYPAPGWIRGDQQATSEILTEINNLRKENSALVEKIDSLKPPISIANLADLNDTHKVKYNYKTGFNTQKRVGEREYSWGDILRIVGGNFRTPTNTSGMRALATYIQKLNGAYEVSIDHATDVAILTQFELVGVVSAKQYSTQGGGSAIFYKLTDNGLREYLSRMAVVKDDNAQVAPTDN